MLTNHFTKTARVLCATVAACTTFCGFESRAEVLMVTSRAEIGAQDTIEWQKLGPAGTEVGNPTSNGGASFQISSKLFVDFQVSKPIAGNFKRLDQEPPAGGGWTGNFAPEEPLLTGQGFQIEAGEGMSAIGMQIQPESTQPFTARIDVFDKDGNSLGSFFNSGPGRTANANDSALFIGVRSDIANIATILVRTDSTVNGGNFAINRVSVAYARRFKFTGEGIYGMTIYRELVLFDSADPGTILSKAPLTGLTNQEEGESMRRIDFRPATEELYGVGNAPGGIYRLYKINPDDGAVTQIGGNLQPVPGSLGFNFEPTTDHARIISSESEQNWRYNPENAALIANDGNLAYPNGDSGFGSNPNVVTLSYTNSLPGASNTTLYVIDTARDVLAIQNPNSGTLTTVGSLGIDVSNFFDSAGLEISPQTGVAYMTLLNPSTQQSHLYTINLATGAATLVGEIGSTVAVHSITTRITPQAEPTPRPTATPTPTPAPTPEMRLWVAGRDLIANEKPDRDDEKISINSTIQQWGYGYRAAVESTDFNLFSPASHTNNAPASQPREAVEGWAAAEGVVLVNTGGEQVPYSAGNVPFKPLHPEQMMLEQSSTAWRPVVRWVAPAASDYRITAKWLDLNPVDTGGAAHVVIDGLMKNGQRLPLQQVFAQEWGDERTAMMPTETFSLAEGATVDFVLGTRAADSSRGRVTEETAFTAAIARLPKVSLMMPGEVAEGQDVPVAVAVEHPFAIKSVRLYLDGVPVPGMVDETAPYEFLIGPDRLGTGTRYVTAVAMDQADTDGVSEPVPVVVTKGSGGAMSAHAAVKAQATDRRVAAASGPRFTFRCTQSGSWFDPATWGGLGVPGRGSDAIIAERFEVSYFAEPGASLIEVDNLTVAGRLVSNRGAVIYGIMQTTGFIGGLAEERGAFVLTIAAGGTFVTAGGGADFDHVLFTNNGTTIISHNGGISSEESVFTNQGIVRILPKAGSNRPTVAYLKSLEIPGGLVSIGSYAQVVAKNGIVAAGAGNIVAAGAGNIVAAGAGNIVAAGAGNLILPASLIGADGASLIGADGASLIGADGASLIGADGASLIGADGGSIVAAGAGNAVGPGTASHAGKTSGPSERVAAATDFGGILLEGGTVGGNLTMGGDVFNTGGFIAPGGSAGRVRVRGNYTQGANGTLVMEVGGTSTHPALQLDQFEVSGTASLGGKLVVKTIDGFTPQSGDNFAPMTYSAVNGSFDSVSSNAQISFGENGATMQVAGPNPPAPKALNIATRMRVEAGDNVLIAGFIITGSEPKKVLIRGIGPSLPVSGALADPTLDLDGGAFFNDEWRSDQQGEIEGTTIPPSSDLESAIVATLDPGAHTAVLRGKNDGTGVGLVEVYDLESGTPSQLANISTRGQVQTGDNVMIGGFIIGGDYPAKVLIRAIGPSLAVEGALQDPTLELVDSNGATISNDNWRSTQEAEIIATTVPPSNDKEAALVATLVPGNYTAVVRGRNDTVGVALVEGYTLP